MIDVPKRLIMVLAFCFSSKITLGYSEFRNGSRDVTRRRHRRWTVIIDDDVAVKDSLYTAGRRVLRVQFLLKRLSVRLHFRDKPGAVRATWQRC